MGGMSRQRSLGVLRPCSGLGKNSPLKSSPTEFQPEELRMEVSFCEEVVFDQPAFFARRHSKQYGDAAKAEKSLPEPLGRHRNKYATTSGFLSSGQPESGLDGMSRPVRRPSFCSSTSGKSTLSSSASDSALPSLPRKLFPSLPQKKEKKQDRGVDGAMMPMKLNDPFECKWYEVDVIKTAKGEQVLREDFHVVFDIYQALDNDVSLSNSKYKQAFKSEIRSRAMQIYQSLMMRKVRSGCPIDLSILDFLKLVWPQLNEREEHILLTWASQRERQLLAINRIHNFK